MNPSKYVLLDKPMPGEIYFKPRPRSVQVTRVQQPFVEDHRQTPSFVHNLWYQYKKTNGNITPKNTKRIAPVPVITCKTRFAPSYLAKNTHCSCCSFTEIPWRGQSQELARTRWRKSWCEDCRQRCCLHWGLRCRRRLLCHWAACR